MVPWKNLDAIISLAGLWFETDQEAALRMEFRLERPKSTQMMSPNAGRAFHFDGNMASGKFSRIK